MVKRSLTIVLLGSLAICVNAQHLPNVGFSEWEDAGSSYQSSTEGGISFSPAGLRQRPGTEPVDWNGSSVNQKVMMSASKILITQGEDDDQGSYAILENKYVGLGSLGSNAPAYLTFGTPWVYAVMDVDDCDGGTYGGRDDSAKPDAISGKYKKSSGDDSEDSYVIAYIWNGTFKSNIKAYGTVSQENTDHAVLGSESVTNISAPTSGYDKSKGKLIAWCNEVLEIEEDDDEWHTIEVPLNYILGNKDLDAEHMNIIISAGDYWNRDNLQNGTKLEVDDVDYVYWNTLKSLKYDGVSLLSGNKTSYTVNKSYDPDLLEVVPKSVFGIYTPTYTSSTGVLNIKVTRANASAKTYKITFYGSQLSAASYDGTDIAWDENNAATVNADYISSKLDLSVPANATVLKSFDYETATLTITVKGGNINSSPSNFHTYTVKFDGPTVDPTKDKQKTETLYVDVDGQLTGPQDADVTIRTLNNGNFNFVLNNFYLGSGDLAQAIGNIAVGDLQLDADGNFEYNDNIVLEPGDDANVSWMGPSLGNVPIQLEGQYDSTKELYYVTIDISIMGQTIQVHLGYDYNTPTMVIGDAKYGTFICPYDVTTPSSVTATTVENVNTNGTLVLSDALTTIPANTPVVVFSETNVNTSMQGAYVKHGYTYTSGLLTGVYVNTQAPVDSYVLQNLSSGVAFYQVATGQQPTVGANRCYLTLDNNAPGVKALAFPDGTMTSISEIQAADEKAVIYDLSGRRVSKATKGIYITNGKKFLVK